jgi:hypothetical protein
MNLPAKCQPDRLPKRFPVGTTYVVEGRGGEDGELRVFSRYLVLPGGRRINLVGNSAAVPRERAKRAAAAKNRSLIRRGRPKKISASAGTNRRSSR